MLKIIPNEAELIGGVLETLGDVLRDIPAVSVAETLREPMLDGARPDLVMHVTAFGKPQSLIIEAKMNAQPRYARGAILQLHDYAAKIDDQAILVLAAPYLSPEVRAICKDQRISYIDLQGNVRIVLENIFIERTVPTRPAVDKRHLRSLFKPKSAQVLRVLLRAPPMTAWKVVDLAHAANVSVGHVSNVRTSLLEREWAIENSEGVILTEPNIVLDAWRAEYVAPAGQRATFYTTSHGKDLETIHFDTSYDTPIQHVARAGFSAAAWIAPYARAPLHQFYVDFAGYDMLRERLNLSHVERGENVVITLLKDLGPLRDTIEAAPGIICTSPVQTYLDLWHLGERGREAAEHLREERLKWPV
jgi:hypothetical protein